MYLPRVTAQHHDLDPCGVLFISAACVQCAISLASSPEPMKRETVKVANIHHFTSCWRLGAMRDPRGELSSFCSPLFSPAAVLHTCAGPPVVPLTSVLLVLKVKEGKAPDGALPHAALFLSHLTSRLYQSNTNRRS